MHFFLKPNPEFEKEHGIREWQNPESEELAPNTKTIAPKLGKFVPKSNIEIDIIDNKDIIDNVIKKENQTVYGISNANEDFAARFGFKE